MTILLAVAVLVAVVATVVTLVALARAQDGYEDEHGFHVIHEVVGKKLSVTENPELTHGATVGFHSPLHSS